MTCYKNVLKSNINSGADSFLTTLERDPSREQTETCCRAADVLFLAAAGSDWLQIS